MASAHNLKWKREQVDKMLVEGVSHVTICHRARCSIGFVLELKELLDKNNKLLFRKVKK